MYKIWFLPMLLLIGCASVPKCQWVDTGTPTFKYIKTQTAESLQAVIDAYKKNDDIINKYPEHCKAGAGFYGEYGFLLMQNGQNDQGRELMRKEIILFPESKTFMLRALGEKE
ncbi:MAG: DUF4810 domain-containing protein [Fibromonadaceae bacterium]|jgi:hypothetical protein|nr:DUF4810 domain-containing protein [Fibromonadaceae bacterium]